MRNLIATMAVLGCLGSWAVACCPPQVATVESTIANASADFMAPNSKGKFSASEAERIGNFGTIKAGLHFSDVSVPQGATIVGARIVVEVAANHVGGAVKVKIRAASQDDPTLPTTLADSNSRPRTTAGTAWETNWQMQEGVHPLVESPDLSAVIQEIVDRPGWAGDRVLIYIEDDGSDALSMDRFYSYELAEHPPKLVIEYLE